MADTKTKKPAQKATHPKYSKMIATAIETLNEKGGSSRVDIVKFITSKYTVSDKPNFVNSQVKLALKRGVANGVLKLDKTAANKPKKVVKSSKAAIPPKKAKRVPAKKPAAVKSHQNITKSPKAVTTKPTVQEPVQK